jgi:transcriptional antiterminator NusG
VGCFKSCKIVYNVGTSIRVIDGPFNNFNGTIVEIKDEKVTIQVKIFGRSTNIELILSQIEKSNE